MSYTKIEIEKKEEKNNIEEKKQKKLVTIRMEGRFIDGHLSSFNNTLAAEHMFVMIFDNHNGKIIGEKSQVSHKFFSRESNSETVLQDYFEEKEIPDFLINHYKKYQYCGFWEFDVTGLIELTNDEFIYKKNPEQCYSLKEFKEQLKDQLTRCLGFHLDFSTKKNW